MQHCMLVLPKAQLGQAVHACPGVTPVAFLHGREMQQGVAEEQTTAHTPSSLKTERAGPSGVAHGAKYTRKQQHYICGTLTVRLGESLHTAQWVVA